MSITDELNKWASSPAGKKRLAEENIKALKAGRSFGKAGKSGVQINRAMVKQYAEDMIDHILAKLPDSLRDSPTPITRASFNEPVIKLDGDTFEVKISFRPDAVHRDSLAPDRWEDGIENIAVHLSNGWSARGAVRGEWHGSETWSRAKFSGDSFMREAVEDFNQQHPAAFAELGVEYNV